MDVSSVRGWEPDDPARRELRGQIVTDRSRVGACRFAGVGVVLKPDPKAMADAFRDVRSKGSVGVLAQGMYPLTVIQGGGDAFVWCW